MKNLPPKAQGGEGTIHMRRRSCSSPGRPSSAKFISSDGIIYMRRRSCSSPVPGAFGGRFFMLAPPTSLRTRLEQVKAEWARVPVSEVLASEAPVV